MNRNHFWKLALILLVLVWAIYEMYPPTSRDLVDYFRIKARTTPQNSATLNAIVQRAQDEEKERPGQSYANLQVAIGTNDITPYFQHLFDDADVTKEAHP